MKKLGLLLLFLCGFSSCHAQETNSVNPDYKDLEYSCVGYTSTVGVVGDEYVAEYKAEYPQIKDFAVVLVLTVEKNKRFEDQIELLLSKFSWEDYFFLDVLEV